MNIIIKKYEHWNTAFGNWDGPKGKYVRSKAHYEQLLREQGLVPVDKLPNPPEKKPFDKTLSPKVERLIKSVALTADKKGRIKAGDRLINGMRECGVNFDLSHCPKHYREGGFDGES